MAVTEATERRLTVIMMADVVGYSRLMEADEAGTLAALRTRRKSILEPVLRAHGGHIVKLMGDGVLVEFTSAVNAVVGAFELQRRMGEANEREPESHQILLRIGINLGDVIDEDADIFGEGGFAGELDEGLNHVSFAQRLSPREYNQAANYSVMGLCPPYGKTVRRSGSIRVARRPASPPLRDRMAYPCCGGGVEC